MGRLKLNQRNNHIKLYFLSVISKVLFCVIITSNHLVIIIRLVQTRKGPIRGMHIFPLSLLVNSSKDLAVLHPPRIFGKSNYYCQEPDEVHSRKISLLCYILHMIIRKKYTEVRENIKLTNSIDIRSPHNKPRSPQVQMNYDTYIDFMELDPDEWTVTTSLSTFTK